MLVCKWNKELGLMGFHTDEVDYLGSSRRFYNGDDKIIIKTKEEVKAVLQTLSLLMNVTFKKSKITYGSTEYNFYTESHHSNSPNGVFPKLIVDHTKINRKEVV